MRTAEPEYRMAPALFCAGLAVAAAIGLAAPVRPAPAQSAAEPPLQAPLAAEVPFEILERGEHQLSIRFHAEAGTEFKARVRGRVINVRGGCAAITLQLADPESRLRLLAVSEDPTTIEIGAF